VEARDDHHRETLQEIRQDWRAVKVCARRLPVDPIGVGHEVLDAVEKRSGALRAQADHVRAIARDRTPDGGRWHPWAMTHPESGLDPGDAARRDFMSGAMEAYVGHVDQGVSSFRRSLKSAKLLSAIAHLVPLAVLAAGIALGEDQLSMPWWAVPIFGVLVFLLVDRLLVTHFIDPVIQGWRRRILDKAADDMNWLALGALGAALSREWSREHDTFG
jgi:hypothetical protein